MTSFGTPDIVDSFVWVIPCLLAILLRPLIVRYVNVAKITMNREVKAIFVCMVFASVGCFLVGVSTLFVRKSSVNALLTQFVIRISICSIGWTLMGAGLEIAEYLMKKMNNFIEKNFDCKRKISLETLELISSVAAYLMTFWMVSGSSRFTLKVEP